MGGEVTHAIRTYRLFSLLAISWLWCVCARAEWFEYAPAGSVMGQGIYAETKSLCPAHGWRQVARMDRATQCHEATHFINREICQAETDGQMYGAFYVGGGKCFIVSEPKVIVAQVARLVPDSLRGQRFREYLSGSRSSRNALTIIDEWTCYANDAQCTNELGLRSDGGLKRASEFSTFADILTEAIKRYDPQYGQLSDLEYFVQWQKHRVGRLASVNPAISIRPRLDFYAPNYQQQRRRARDQQPADLAPCFRRSNPDGSCVHCSTVMQMRWLGLYDWSDYWWSTYRGGESDYGLQRKLLREGFDFAVTHDGDSRMLEWAISSRRGAVITWGGAHSVWLVGRENGQAVILDNNHIGKFRYQPWQSFLREWRSCGGWAFVILNGQVPAPTPERA